MTDQVLQDFWVQSAAAAFAGLVVAAILAIRFKALRTWFWLPIGRAVRWVFGLQLRLTTQKQRDNVASELQKERTDAAEALDGARTRGQKDLQSALMDAAADRRMMQDNERALWERLTVADRSKADALAALEERHEENLSRVSREVSENFDVKVNSARREGYDQAMNEVAEQRSRPGLKPSWHIRQGDAPDEIVFVNGQRGADLSDVEVDADSEFFRFLGDKAMRGSFDNELRVKGSPTRSGRRLGVNFFVSWADANGDRDSAKLHLEKEPPAGSVVL